VQKHTLNFTAIFGEERHLVRSAVKRAVILGTIEAELDCVDSADAQRERRKADHYADRYTGDEAPLDDYQRDTSERYVFDPREIPPRVEQPSTKHVQATVEQQTAQDELRYVSGTELRSATTDAPIVVEMKVAAMP
jgi:hypothetical protein